MEKDDKNFQNFYMNQPGFFDIENYEELEFFKNKLRLVFNTLYN